MNEIEKRIGAQSPALWKFLPLITLAAVTRVSFEVEPWAALPLLILTVASVLLPFPISKNKGLRDIDAWKIHTTQGDKRRAARHRGPHL